MSSPATVIPLDPAAKRRAAETLAQAFRDDPVYTFVFPAIDDRLRYTARLAEALITSSLRYGEVYTTPDLTGVACWLRPGQTEFSFWQALRTGFPLQRAVMAFPKEARERMLSLVDYIDKLRRRTMQGPFWYLTIIGVSPTSQGKGVGSALLQPVLQQADAAATPCYLETETESNVAFYEKRGFAVVTAEELPGHPLKLWTMVRQPQQD